MPSKIVLQLHVIVNLFQSRWEKRCVKEDKSAVELTEPRKPVPAPRKRRDPTNEMVDRSQNRDIDTEEDENVVVVTTTTELVPEEGNTEVAASVADTSADSSADGLEDTDLDGWWGRPKSQII